MTERRTEQCRVAPELPFRAPDGTPVTLREVSVRAEWDGGRPDRIVLEFTLDPAEWARVDQGAWFHLAPDRRGATFGGGLDPARPVELELRLSDTRLGRFSDVLDVFDVAAHLFAEAPDGPLRATESWYALYVKQQHPRLPVKTGFQTSWVE